MPLACCALVLASGGPAALVDWNNNYGDDPDKAVVFHCSNLPKTLMVDEKPRMESNAILGNTFGPENAFGTIVGRVRPGPFTYLRVSTDDAAGRICAYMGEGEFTDDALDTFGGYGVVRVPCLQELLALHLRERVRASRCSRASASGADSCGSAGQVPRMVRAPPRKTKSDNRLTGPTGNAPIINTTFRHFRDACSSSRRA